MKFTCVSNLLVAGDVTSSDIFLEQLLLSFCQMCPLCIMLATVEFDGNTIMPTSTAKTSSQVGQLVSTAEEYTSYRRGFCVK